ncbi:MAG: T9SS type A sorting domain-containing protein [Phaeodactylibacter sp.]|nr:T9SS type A sorting domain-containing protein [Phaeodactylibacter sp.]
MRSFIIGGNSLEGEIPENVFPSWPDLVELSLNDMQLSGKVDLSDSQHFDGLLWLQNTLISEVDLRNGHNSEIALFIPDNPNFLGNPNLYCIYVDDAEYSANNWPLIESQASYLEDDSSDCNRTVNTDDTFQPRIKLYPNPTSGTVQIQVSDPMKIEEITVFNSVGKIISTDRIDLSSFPGGMYFVKIKGSQNTIFTYKIIRE